MLTITQDEVKAVYEALVDATRVAFSAGETAVMVKTALEAAWAARPAPLTIIAPLYRVSGLSPFHLAIWMPDKVFDDLVSLARHLEQNRPPMGEHLSHRMTKVAVDAPGVIAWVDGWTSSQPEIDDIPECGMLLPEDGDWQPRPPLDPMSEDRLDMVFVVHDDGMLTVKDDRENWATIDLFELVMDVQEARAR